VVSALATEPHPAPGPTLRWRIAVLVSAAIAISYLDRQTLPVAIKAIERDIPVTNQQFSLLQTAFLTPAASTSRPSAPSRGSPPRRRAWDVSSADGSQATCCRGNCP
jgi:hypothetical protein